MTPFCGNCGSYGARSGATLITMGEVGKSARASCSCVDGESLELDRLRHNFLAEQESAALYQALAEFERDSDQRAVYLELAAAERAHAAFWAERLHAAGVSVPALRISARTRILAQLARWLGGGFVIPVITARELNDRNDYEHQGDAVDAGLAAAEQGHAERLRERSGFTVATKLRAAVLGANDGLASNFCLLMGVVGGGAKTATVLLTGIAGLTGGALSMALGEWLSVMNAGELAESLMDRDVKALHRARQGESGGSGPTAEAWSAARFSFGLFALGAILPLLPFAVLRSGYAIAASIGASLAGLFVLGLATSLFNGRSPIYSALRQIGIGAGAAIATYAVGRLFALVSG